MDSFMKVHPSILFPGETEFEIYEDGYLVSLWHLKLPEDGPLLASLPLPLD